MKEQEKQIKEVPELVQFLSFADDERITWTIDRKNNVSIIVNKYKDKEKVGSMLVLEDDVLMARDWIKGHELEPGDDPKLLTRAGFGLSRVIRELNY